MSHTTNIQDLALELIQEIVLDACLQEWDGSPRKTDLSTFRLISREFKHLVDPLLFSEITFNFVRRPVISVIDQLNDLATEKTPASKYTRTLDIGTTQLRPEHENPTIIIARDKFGTLLLHAVKALHNLRSVRWVVWSFEELYTILNGLAELKRLEELDLTFSTFSGLPRQIPDTTPNLSLHGHLGNLRSVKIRGHLSSDLSNILVLQLRTMNQANPTSLECLEYDCPPIVVQEGEKEEDEEEGLIFEAGGCLVHEIVRGLPDNSPLQLKRLRVNGWSLRMDSVTIPHLRRLTHLDVSQYQGKHHRLAHMWHQLNKERIHLRAIRTDTVSYPFISYLLSYTGLEDLWTTYNPNENPKSMKQIAGELYKSALPHHKDTLKVFRALNRSDVKHCVSPDYMLPMRCCHKLETLMINVDGGAELGLREENQEVLKLALNIPSLKTLAVHCTRPPRPRPLHPRRSLKLPSWTLEDKEFADIIESLVVSGNISRDLGSCQILFNQRRYIVKEEKNGELRFHADDKSKQFN